MRRAICVALIALLAFPACAVRQAGRFQMALNPSPTRHTQAGAGDPESRDRWRTFVQKLPVGSKVKLQLADGQRVKGVLMGVENDQVVVHVRTRIPEPPRVLPFASISWLELDSGGIGPGKVVAIAASVAGAAVLGLILFAYAISD
jgi:hypothetical protein